MDGLCYAVFQRLPTEKGWEIFKHLNRTDGKI